MNYVLILFEVACILTGIAAVTDKEKNSSIVGKNVCNTTVKYAVETEKQSKHTFSKPVTKWCNRFPTFRCTTNKILDRIEVRKIIEYKNKTVFECCEGYQNVSGRCVSICKNGCLNGECVSPNNCSCFGGWKGSNCSEVCEEGSYGKGCIDTCLCQNGAACDKINGTCSCLPGYIGDYCETFCSGHFSGNECENVCKCKNGAVCNVTDRSCDCLPGYFGKQCQHKCPKGSYGKDCRDTCKCKMDNIEVCNHITGECLCKPGWRGDHCEKACEDQTWGPFCKNKCECGLKGSCHRVTGECSCVSGWHGPKCEKECPVGYFEKDCKMKCPDCLHKPGTCHHETGWCNCPDGFNGPLCDLQCPDGKYGKDCNNICLCSSNSTCDTVTGECLCLPGWIGPECEFPCPEGTYGDNCSFSCNCSNKYSCNRFDGNCNCDETDDDPQCLKGPLIQDVEDNKMLPVVLILAFIIFGVLISLILLVRIYLKRKKHTDIEVLRDDGISTAIRDEGSSASDSRKFMNPVYEVMDEFIRPSPTSLAELQPYKYSTDDKNYFEVDFKIPDCGEAKVLNNTSQENSKAEIQFNTKPKETNLNRVSIDPPNIKFSKTAVNSADFENPFQRNSIYGDVDLKEEHHYEFPNRRINDTDTVDITQKKWTLN